MLFLAQFVLYKLFYVPYYLGYTLQHFPNSDLLRQALEKKNEVIFFGDSTVRFNRLEDKDKKTIPQMLQVKIPDSNVTSISYPGYSADVFLAYVQRISRSGRWPKCIIIPINLRSFSVGWDKRPQYQFVEERTLIAPKPFLIDIFLKPLMVFRVINLAPISQQDYENAEVLDGTTRVGKVKDFQRSDASITPEQALQNHFILDYMEKLTGDNRKIKSIAALVRLLSGKNTRTIFYVSPVDVDAGSQSLGKRFQDQIQENVAFIRMVLRKEQLDLLDLSLDVKHEDFDWNPYPNEHLKEAGRRFVADELSKKISPALKMDAWQ